MINKKDKRRVEGSWKMMVEEKEIDDWRKEKNMIKEIEERDVEERNILKVMKKRKKEKGNEIKLKGIERRRDKVRGGRRNEVEMKIKKWKKMEKEKKIMKERKKGKEEMSVREKKINEIKKV